MNRTSLRRVLVPAVALIPLVALSACADDSDTSPATTTPASTPSDDGEATGPTTTLGPYVAPLSDVVGEALTKEGQFTTLAAMLVETGLVPALRGDGPFTVFAPINDAFTALPSDTLDAVWADLDLLTSILTYHVIAGEALGAADLTDGRELTTLEGRTLVVSRSGDDVTINGIPVLIADVPATNGVSHAIGGVLVPEG